MVRGGSARAVMETAQVDGDSRNDGRGGGWAGSHFRRRCQTVGRPHRCLIRLRDC